MLEFFNKPDSYGQGTQLPPSWPYIKEGLTRNLNTVKEYYYNKPFAVKSNHLLARILNNIGVSYFYTLERFADIVDAKAFNIAMNFRLSSPIYRGNIFRDIFYGGDVDEIIVAVDNHFDIYDVYKNWQKVNAVNVIYHPKSDLDLQLPNGKYISNESGSAVISINIAMLAVQYKAFLEQEYLKNNTDQTFRTLSQFIHMFVLPNMLDSHLDVALFNRAYKLLNNEQLGTSYKKHVFHVIDFTSQVDSAYKNIINGFLGSERFYKTILRSFPTVTCDNFEQVLVLPINAPTKQIIWTNVVARIKAIKFLAKLASNNGNKLDRMNNQIFLRNFKLYENDKALDMIVNTRSQIENKLAIQEVKEMITI